MHHLNLARRDLQQRSAACPRNPFHERSAEHSVKNICQPSSHVGENPPCGMIGGVEETSASFEDCKVARADRTADAHCPR